MKNVFFAVMALAVSFTETRAADSPAIVPMPQHIAYATGEGAVLSAGSRIAVPGGAKALRSVAELFVRDICREHGLRLKVSGISESGIVLGIDPALRAEAYSLDIGQGRVAVTGGSPSGLFYGLQSLRQLISQYGMRLPAVHVEDEPCFAYRGAMLDCCRHFFTVDEIKTFSLASDRRPGMAYRDQALSRIDERGVTACRNSPWTQYEYLRRHTFGRILYAATNS